MVPFVVKDEHLPEILSFIFKAIELEQLDCQVSEINLLIAVTSCRLFLLDIVFLLHFSIV